MARTTLPSSTPRRSQKRTHGLIIAATLGLTLGGLALYSHRNPPSPRSQSARTTLQEENRLRQEVEAAPEDPGARLRYIEFLRSLGRNSDALDAAQDARTALPQDREVRAAYVDSLAASGRVREAIQLLTGKATDTGERLQLARYLIQDGQLSKATSLLHTLNAPTPIQALTGAQLLIDARDPAGAVVLLKPVFKQSPGGEVRNHYGFALLLSGRYREAAELLLASARENPQVPPLHYYAGSALRLSGNLAQLTTAEQELRQAVALASQDAFFQYELALCLAQKRDWEGARDALQSAVTLNPDVPEIQRDLARAYTKTKQEVAAAIAQARYLHLVDDAPTAVKLLEPLAQQNPQDVELGLELSVVLNAASRFTEAAAVVERLRALHPDQAQILWSRYRLQSALKQYDRALESVQLLEKQFGPDTLILQEQAETLQQLARHAEAEAILVKLRDREPENAQWHYGLGLALSLWSTRPDAKEVAEAELRRSLQLRPADAAASYALGQLLLGTGRTADAISNLRRAVDLVPTHLDAQRLLGRAYLQQGDKARSADAFRIYRFLQNRIEERRRLELPVQQLQNLHTSRMALARYDLRTGDLKRATRELEQVVYQFPEDREAHQLLEGLLGHARRFQAQFEQRMWLRAHGLAGGVRDR